MLYHSAEKVRSNDLVIDTVQSDVDYVDSNGDIHIHTKVGEIIITDEADLASLSGYNVGSIAYLAGFSKMWQLDASGDWVEIGGSEATQDDSSEVTQDDASEGAGD